MPIRLVGLAVAVGLLTIGAACTKPAASNTSSRDGQTVTVNTSVDQNLNLPVVDLTNTAGTNSTNNAATNRAATAPLSATVSITSSGFLPATVTIGVGGTVTWKNDDLARHQPASDPHPAHTGLAGFDAVGGLGQGETYQYTFTRTGTFPYHDHNFTLRQATVVVQ